MRDFLVLAEPAVLYRPTLLATEVLTFCLVFREDIKIHNRWLQPKCCSFQPIHIAFPI